MRWLQLLSLVYSEKWKTCFTQIPGTKDIFSGKVGPNNDGFKDEPVVQWDFQVVEYTFVDDSK